MNNTSSEVEKAKIDTILNKYQTGEKKESIQDRILKLDRMVEAPGQIVSLIMGILGTLIFGAGMSFVLVFEQTILGIILSVAGVVILAPAYSVYKRITAIRRKKYGKEILELAKNYNI